MAEEEDEKVQFWSTVLGGMGPWPTVTEDVAESIVEWNHSVSPEDALGMAQYIVEHYGLDLKGKTATHDEAAGVAWQAEVSVCECCYRDIYRTGNGDGSPVAHDAEWFHMGSRKQQCDIKEVLP